MKEYRFKAKLQPGDGGGVFVEFPYDVKKEFGKGKVPIQCTIDGVPYRGTMVKYGLPKHLILVLKETRKKIGKDVGDEVDIWLIEDLEPRIIETPTDFKRLLQKNKLEKLFEELSFTHRREYIQWITSAKKEETRLTRMQKAVEMIKAKG